jgi:hypothetical protein
MVKARIYTKEELELICNPQLTAKEIGLLLSVSPITVSRERVKLGVATNRGAKKGRSNIKKMRQEERICIGKECSNTFTVIQSSKKKYCSHSCQQKTANVAAKGVGSRKMRNPNTPEYKKYSRIVHGLSQKVYEENIDIINPNQYPRTLCGVDGGWQLDHIITIKECFEKGVTPKEASSINNLRMLPWKKNLMRQYDIQD